MLVWKETLVRSFYNHRKDIWTFAGIQNCENLPADSRSAVGKASLSADWSRISLWTAALPGSQHWDGAERNVTPLPSSLLFWRQWESTQGQTFFRWPIIACKASGRRLLTKGGYPFFFFFPNGVCRIPDVVFALQTRDNPPLG